MEDGLLEIGFFDDFLFKAQSYFKFSKFER